ncbi:MAG: hypothetical protein SCALA702_33210 [Melioribacteraceae bacterium]|nr:MAG: hypothetical protein SCALA702_33210 [Melioribacteraceae bacterium]
MKGNIIFIFLFTCSLVFPQKYFNWASHTLPGEVKNWGVVTQDSIFITTTNQQCWRSTDGGSSWRTVYGNLPSDIYSVSTVNSRIFVSCRQGNLKFTDDLGDKVYSAYLEETAPFEKICGPPDNLYGLSTSAEMLYKSSDFGENWKPVINVPPGTTDLDVNENGEVYISREDEVLKFDFSQNAWKSLYAKSSVSALKVAGGAVALISDFRFVYSRSSGAHWDSLNCVTIYRDIFTDRLNNFYFSVLLCNGTASEIALFSVDLISGEIEQLQSKGKGSFDDFYVEQPIICVEEDQLLVQQEEYTPQYPNDFFPLSDLNEWLYLSEVFIHESQQKGYSFELNKITAQHIFNERVWYSLEIDGGLPYYSYTSAENVLQIYNGEDEGIREISFNYSDNYMQPYFLPDLVHFQLAPLLSFTPSGTLSEKAGRSYIRNYFCAGEYDNLEFVSGIGKVYHTEVTYDEKSIYHELLQAKIVDDEGVTQYYDKIKDPRIVIVGEPHWESDIFHLNCRVHHDLILPAQLDTLNFIDSVYVEYEISNEVSLDFKDAEMLICDSIATGKAYYEIYLNLEKYLNEKEYMTLSYRTVVKTAGIFPHAAQTDWKDIPFSTVGFCPETKFTDFSLSENYPNPFNPSTKMEFTLPKESDVRISVYNVTGEELFTAAAGNYKAGRHEVNINMSDYSSGVYFVRMIAGEKNFTQKIMLLK